MGKENQDKKGTKDDNIFDSKESNNNEVINKETGEVTEKETEKPVTTLAKQTSKVSDILAKSKSKGTFEGLKSGDVLTVLNSYKEQISQALPKHLTADRMIQMATTHINQNPEIAKCTAGSLIGAIMQASILGFKPVSAYGQCYFVPYNKNVGSKDKPVWVKEVQFQIGYKGYIALARRSQDLKMIYAEVVRKGDKFEFQMGLEPQLLHIPNQDTDGEITHVYAVAHYKDGGYNFVVLTRKQVEKLRKRSPMQKDLPSGAWFTDYDAMAKAKAIKQLAKYLPSEELTLASEVDEKTIQPDKFTPDNTGTLADLEYVNYEELNNGGN